MNGVFANATVRCTVEVSTAPICPASPAVGHFILPCQSDEGTGDIHMTEGGRGNTPTTSAGTRKNRDLVGGDGEGS